MTHERLIYLDNHATTRCDPRVVQAMLPLLTDDYGNPHSTSHAAGRQAAEIYGSAVDTIAGCLGATADELVMTSGATESNNLAILGACLHPRQKRRTIVTLQTEHPAVLDPLARLEREGFTIRRLPVMQQHEAVPGRVCLERLAEAVDEQTALVSVMWANNEIGVLQNLRGIADRCHAVGSLLHTDATQAVGRIPVDVMLADVDLLSASAHKFYGPKGVGLLYVRSQPRRVRLRPLVEGGGQQRGLRSGTLNPAGVVGMAAALRICHEQGDAERQRIAELRDRLWSALSAAIPAVALNGPPLGKYRLPGNLNVRFPEVEGESLMADNPTLACSSGSACSSVDPRPSHVLLALGLSEAEARSSLRFGVGRFNTAEEIDRAAELLAASHRRLRMLA